jgi:hypothetical protein
MIWLCQYLCPQRHALVAVAYESPGQTPQEIEAYILAELPKQGVNPWCGICGRHDLHFEHGATSFQTMEAARPSLQREARKHAVTRAWFGGRY